MLIEWMPTVVITLKLTTTHTDLLINRLHITDIIYIYTSKQKKTKIMKP